MRKIPKQKQAPVATSSKTRPSCPSRSTSPSSPSHASSQRKPLTAEQRARKNQRDRERRARQRRLRKQHLGLTKPAVAVTAAKSRGSDCCGASCHSSTAGVSCAGCPHAAIARSSLSAPSASRVPVARASAPSLASLTADLRQLCRTVCGALPAFRPVPRSACSPLTVVEPGVLQQCFRLSDGRTARVTVVDAETVNPLSAYSPLPSELRRSLLLASMARDISALVDARRENRS